MPLTAAALLATLPACSGGEQAAPETPPLELSVMSFNIEYGGDRVDFGQVVEAIRAAGADVVGIQEAWGQMPRLAGELGWWFYNSRMQVVSRHRLIDPGGAEGRYVLVEVAPGRVVALGNVHLPSDPYGPSEVRDGASPDEVLALERELRLPAIVEPLAALSALAAEGVPTFLTGDLNSPAASDWTAVAVGRRPHLRYPLAWPVSLAVEGAGFRDSWRELHPDPLAEPGLTWPAGRREVADWNPGPDETHERIDFVFVAGEATTTASRLVGEPGAAGVSVAVDPWPSDHRAVVATFRVVPAPMPVLVAVERRSLAVGEPLRVVACGPGGAGERVVVRAPGGEPAVVAAEHLLGPAQSKGATLEFATTALAPGAYEVALLDAEERALARTEVWLLAPGATPEIRPGAERYAPGEPIAVTWRAAPGNRWDWVGVYAAEADPQAESPLLWRYTGATIAGEATLDATAEGDGWPLAAGDYRVSLFPDDGYEPIASAAVTIVDQAVTARSTPPAR